MRNDAELSKQSKTMVDKAIYSIEVAKELHARGHYNDAVSKAYYAVFHSLQAILLTKFIEKLCASIVSVWRKKREQPTLSEFQATIAEEDSHNGT